jgi:alkanesulfonate monooxygenase SsuD/methylene tetrahydromethanopterin reductase-like flavin-dependent oxidoreductase (luciferase family)
LTTVPSPQGRPVLMQAGSSGRGREFAAKHADLIVGTASSVESMKAYRDDIHARLGKYGRKPADCKVLFLATPIVADTDAEAHERSRLQGAQSTADFEARISGMSKAFEIDLSKFDLDKPLPADLTTEGHQGMLATMVASGRTLREIMGGEGVADAKSRDAFGPGSLIGSPATVAGRMGEMMEEVGGDGFLIVNLSLDRRYISEITDGLVPALQRRGLTRSSYEYEQFRDNLLAF